MSRPRPIIKSRSYLATRRCAQREFLLRPERDVDEGFKFILAEAARCYGIRIFAVVVMSNHYHLVLSDPRGVLPAFVHRLNSATGHAFNVKRRRRENFWSSRVSKPTFLVELEDIIAKIVYTLVNPVQAGLVQHARDWPGVTSFGWLDGRIIRTKRPHYYFDPDGHVTPESTLQISIPEEFEGDRDAWEALIKRRVEEEEVRIAADRRARGLWFRGSKAVRSDSVHRRGSADEELGELQPLLAASRPDAMQTAKRALKLFQKSHRTALEKIRNRVWSVVFPLGTWLMVQRFNVSVTPS